MTDHTLIWIDEDEQYIKETENQTLFTNEDVLLSLKTYNNGESGYSLKFKSGKARIDFHLTPSWT